MKKKRFLSLTLAACMLFGSAAVLPEGAFDYPTGITASAEVFYDLRVAGVRVTDETKDDILQKGNKEAIYDPDTNTLILKKDFTVDADTKFDGITVNKPVTIRVDNDVKITVTKENYSAIRCNADTTITGNGKLTLESNYAGIRSKQKNVTIEDADIDIISSYFGIYDSCYLNYLTINNSNVDIQTNLAAVVGYYGITLNNCGITTPVGAIIKKKSISDNELFIADKDGEYAKNVKILNYRSWINDTACPNTASGQSDVSLSINGEDNGWIAYNVPLGAEIGVSVNEKLRPEGMRLNYWKAAYSINDYNDIGHGYNYGKETTFLTDTFTFDFPDEAITGLWDYFKDNDIDPSTYDWSKIEFRIHFTPVYINCEHKNVTLHEAKDVTCTEDGNIEYYKCEDCKLCFTDEALTEKIAEKDTVVPSKWHDWGDIVYEWEPDGSACTATRICKKDPTHIETETVASYRPSYTPATCTEDGSATYLAVFKNYDFKRQTKDIVIKAAGHKWQDWVTKIKPTCTEKGEKWRKCSVCDNYETDDIEALGHKFGEWTVYASATCTMDGLRGHTCKVCGAYESEKIEKLGHDYKDTIVKPTCTERGYTRHGCTRCYEGYNDSYTPALGHKFGDWQVTRQPTCGDYGEKEHTCSVCHITEGEPIEKLSEHSFGEWEMISRPTCTKEGLREHTCTICRFTERETMPKLTEHCFGEWETLFEPTCTSDGQRGHSCSACGIYVIETIEKLGHNYKDTVVDPTCTEQGYTLHKCSRCKDSYKDTYTDTTDHTFGDWTVTTAPTCTDKGVETRKCKNCKATETREVKALGHDYKATVVAPTCTANGYTLHKCSRCEDFYKDTYTDTTDHTFGDWTVTTAPTCTVKGVETRKCKNCEATETREVKALGHDYKATVVAPTCTSKGYTLHKCSRCEDFYKDTYTDTTDHTFGDWTVTTAPTCTVKGVETRKCKNCEATETREFKSLGHDYKETVVDPTCTSKGYTLHKCSRCSDSYKDNYTDPTGHSFGDWRVTTAPTCTAKGVETRKCKNCEATENRDIDPLGHKWGDWRTTKEATTTAEGKKERTCSVCKKTETQTIPKKSETGITINRLAGSGRYETAAKISQASFTTAETVVLAYGLNYADALAGVSLATSLNAPILLTNTKSLDSTTLAEIKRLKAKNVIILGGTGAISTAVETTLKKEGLETERIAGASRFGTATAIAEKLNEKPTDVFFVYAFNSADALSVSPIAACKNAPIIYLTTKGELNADTAAYLAKLKKAGCVKNAYVIGGSGVISDDMMNKAAKALGLSKATRIAGKDRFATCVAVNEKFADVLDGDMLCVATGMDFPDALAGGVYAALNRAPLFLINGKLKTPQLSDEQKAYLKTKAAAKITAFGGVGVVPDNHIADIAKNSI